jgi:hypothetical protein
LHKNCLLQDVAEGKIDWTRRREKNLSSSWITLNKTEFTGILKRKLFKLSEELALEEAIDLSQCTL